MMGSSIAMHVSTIGYSMGLLSSLYSWPSFYSSLENVESEINCC